MRYQLIENTLQLNAMSLFLEVILVLVSIIINMIGVILLAMNSLGSKAEKYLAYGSAAVGGSLQLLYIIMRMC